MRVSVSRSIPELSSVTGLLSWEPWDSCGEKEGDYHSLYHQQVQKWKDNTSWHYAGDIAQCQMFSKPFQHLNISRLCACLLMIASEGRQLIRLRNGVALCGRVCLRWPGGAVIPRGWLLKEGDPVHTSLTCGQATRTLGTCGSLQQRLLIRVVIKPGSQTHSSFYYTSQLKRVKRHKPLSSALVMLLLNLSHLVT